MSHINFLGIPVEGVITPGGRVPQRPLEELQPLLRALLDDGEIVEFGWRQFTPYFNDGDPCIFAINEIWVRTIHDIGRGREDMGIGHYAEPHATLGEVPRTWQGGWQDRRLVEEAYVGTDEPRYRRARTFADALTDGAFGDVLIEAFGDHAEVTVRRTGISVSFYEHE